MAERLVILIDDARENVRWLVVDGQGNRVGSVQDAPLTEVTRQAEGRRVTVLVPGFDVIILAAHVPSRSRQKVAQALPFALEDQLAEDIDDLHFALGPRRADGAQTVAVVRHEDMERWQARLKAAGIEADSMLPDFMALPDTEGRWSLALDEQALRIRSGTTSGLVLDRASAATAMSRWLKSLDESDRPAAARLEAASAVEADAEQLLDRLRECGIETELEPNEFPLLSRCGATLQAAETFDLLQGPYRRRSGMENEWRRWRPAAILAAAWLILFGVQQGFNIYQLRQREAALQAQVKTLFHRALPQATSLEEPEIRVRRELDALRARSGGDSAFLDTLAAAGNALASSSGTKMKAFDYRDGKLQLNLIAKDMHALDDFKQKLGGTSGYDVEINSANAADDGVEGQLTVSGGGE